MIDMYYLNFTLYTHIHGQTLHIHATDGPTSFERVHTDQCR